MIKIRSADSNSWAALCQTGSRCGRYSSLFQVGGTMSLAVACSPQIWQLGAFCWLATLASVGRTTKILSRCFGHIVQFAEPCSLRSRMVHRGESAGATSLVRSAGNPYDGASPFLYIASSI